MRTILNLCFLSLVVLNAFAQVLPDNRATDWTLAGLTEGSRHSITRINMREQGADPSGNSSCNDVIASAFASLRGKSGVIFFPAGTYLFDSTISLPDSVVIQGDGASETVFNFNLGGSGDLILAQGGWSGTPDTLVASAFAGDSIVEVFSGTDWQVGDLARLHKDDQDLVNDSWAYYSVAQIVRIKAINGNLLTLDQPLRTDFTLNRFAALRKMNPRRQIGIECLKIKRLDTSVTQSKNIHFRYATECWVKGVESDQCNFGHVVIDLSSHIEVSGSYFHHAFDYGGGGKGYGVVLHGSASLCLVQDNIFNHLRHSILLQSGANGNVISFNYSTDPFWTSFPTNGAGDIVCHGNYPFLNLFDHNVVQNIVIDNSHDANGPYNTFFRNRAELYGIIMSASNSPNQNFIGNEITGSGTLKGNYTLMGSGHFEYGNNDNGTVVPTGTGDLMDISYYYQNSPKFITEPLPLIGPPVGFNTKSIPARDRYLVPGERTVCIGICDQSYYGWKGWTGCAQNTNWHDPLNWSGGEVPSIDDAIIIPAGMGLNYPVVSEDVTIQILIVEEGASIQIPEGINFQVLADRD